MIHWMRGAWATCDFELRRSFTAQRTGVSIVLMLFPPLMVGLMIFATRGVKSVGIVHEVAPFAIVFLVSLVCLLSLLLWATTNVYSELEGKSWSFVSSRPGGRISIYLGKFLASVVVSFGISVIALSLSILVADQMISLKNPERLWGSLTAIYLIACFVYGSIFSMLGTIFFKRAMVVAAGYLIGSEVFLATIPALISKLTIRFHLQELGISWIGFFIPFEAEDEYEFLYGEPWPDWVHIVILISMGLITLTIGAWVIVNREYITSDEA